MIWTVVATERAAESLYIVKYEFFFFLRFTTILIKIKTKLFEQYVKLVLPRPVLQGCSIVASEDGRLLLFTTDALIFLLIILMRLSEIVPAICSGPVSQYFVFLTQR